MLLLLHLLQHEQTSLGCPNMRDILGHLCRLEIQNCIITVSEKCFMSVDESSRLLKPFSDEGGLIHQASTGVVQKTDANRFFSIHYRVNNMDYHNAPGVIVKIRIEYLKLLYHRCHFPHLRTCEGGCTVHTRSSIFLGASYRSSCLDRPQHNINVVFNVYMMVQTYTSLMHMRCN